MQKPLNLHSISALQEIHVSDGLKLRLLKNSDIIRILKIMEMDSNIRNRVSLASRLHTPEDIAAEIESYKKNTGVIRYVLLQDNNPVGLISFWHDRGYLCTPSSPNDYGFGYFLDPNERGKGLITRAIQSLIDIVVKNIHVNQFVAFCEDDNIESIAVLTRLGFKPTDETFSEPKNGWIERKYKKSVYMKEKM